MYDVQCKTGDDPKSHGHSALVVVLKFETFFFSVDCRRLYAHWLHSHPLRKNIAISCTIRKMISLS